MKAQKAKGKVAMGCKVLYDMQMLATQVEDFVPIPVRATASPGDYAHIRARAQAACNTAGLLLKEGYEDSPPDIDKLRNLSSDMLWGALDEAQTSEGVATGYIPAKKRDAAQAARELTSTPEGATYVNTLLTQYDMEVVHDAKRLRNYVTNRLILETEDLDPRIRLKALELLGKVSDVGLFTERTEITVNNRSTVELENTLRDKLRRLMGTDTAEDATVLAPPIKADVIDVRAALRAGTDRD